MNARVLVVDDDHDAAETLAVLIHALGYQAKAVYDGQHAIQEIGTFLLAWASSIRHARAEWL